VKNQFSGNITANNIVIGVGDINDGTKMPLAPAGIVAIKKKFFE